MIEKSKEAEHFVGQGESFEYRELRAHSTD